MGKKILWGVAAGALIGSMFVSAAGAVTIDDCLVPGSASSTCFLPNVHFNGVEPTPPPGPLAVYFGALFTDVVGGVQLDMKASASITKSITDVWFNLDPSFDLGGGPANLIFTPDPGLASSIDHATPDTYQADGDGIYDVHFAFTGQDSLEAEESASYLITCPLCGSAFDAESFNFESATGGNKGTFRIAIQLGGSFIGGVCCPPNVSPQQEVPNPPSLGLIGVALIGLGYVVRKKLTK